MQKQSEKDISKRMDVSVSKIDRVISDISCKTVLRHQTLPINMNWDEFKATKDTAGKMAFLIVDNNTGTIFDILNTRKSNELEKFFKRYQKKDRDKVKLICTDFYPGYINTANKIFKNADIVIDRFHIVTQVYTALNSYRIGLCYKKNPNYNKLKHYWKLILKNKNDLTEEKRYSNYFKKDISQKEIVTYLINTDKDFKTNYEVYQGIINSLKNKEYDKFKAIIYNSNKGLSNKMIKAMSLFKKNIIYIENSFKYDINNGVIEGVNNFIKQTKRTAYGYRKFSHFITRIFLIKGIIKG